MRMLRLAKLGVIWDRIEGRLGSMLLLKLIDFLRVLFVVFAICHWNACFWWIVGLPESIFTEILSDSAQAQYSGIPHWTTLERKHGSYEASTWRWIDKNSLESYVFCFYWTLGVMRTMPAEATPVNLPERIYVLGFMFFALSAFAICVAKITQSFFNFNERKRVFNEEMAAVRMYLRKIQAGDGLQSRVKTLLRYRFDTGKIHAKETSLVSQLPVEFSTQLKRQAIMRHVGKIDTFMQCMSPAFARRLVYLVEPKDLMPGDVLATKGHISTAAWVLIFGRLQRTPIQKRIGPDLVVDELCLASEDEYVSEFTVRAAEASEVYRIDKQRFFEELRRARAVAPRTSVRDGESKARRRSHLDSVKRDEAYEGGEQAMVSNIASVAGIVSS